MEETKKICAKEGCNNEVIGHGTAKYCLEHRSGIPKKKKTPLGENRIKLFCTLDQFEDLMARLKYPPFEIHLK